MGARLSAGESKIAKHRNSEDQRFGMNESHFCRHWRVRFPTFTSNYKVFKSHRDVNEFGQKAVVLHRWVSSRRRAIAG